MAYCTQKDLLKLIPELELAELTMELGNTPDTEVVDECIALADAEINSYLAVRYTLPLSNTPARIKALSVDMAIYHLYSRKDHFPEVRRQKYEDAVAFLKAVASGKAEIIGADGLEITSDSTTVVEISSNNRLFSRNTLEGW